MKNLSEEHACPRGDGLSCGSLYGWTESLFAQKLSYVEDDIRWLGCCVALRSNRPDLKEKLAEICKQIALVRSSALQPRVEEEITQPLGGRP